MTPPTPSWLRRHWMLLGCLLFLLGFGTVTAGVLAWKSCADAADKNQSAAALTQKNPAAIENNPAAGAVKVEPKPLLSSYSSAVNALAFSLDGLRLATAAVVPNSRGEIIFWDLVSEREERANRNFRGQIYSLPFSPDGKTLAIGDRGYISRSGNQSSTASDIKLWDFDTVDKPSIWQKADQGIFALVFNPQGDRLAVGGYKGGLTLYNRTTKKPELSLSTESLRPKSGDTWFANLAFSPDGKQIAWGGMMRPDGPQPHYRSVIQVWDAVTGKPLRTLHPPDAADGGAPSVHGIAFLPDNKTLLASCARNIYFWNLHSGELETTLSGHQAPIQALALSADGELLATSDSYACIKLWQMSTRREKTTLRGPTIVVQGLSPPDQKQGQTVALAFDPAREILASSTLYPSEKGRQGVVQLWDLLSLKEIDLLH